MANEQTTIEKNVSEDLQSFAFTYMAAIIRGIVGTIIAIFIFTQVHRIEDETSLAKFTVLVEEIQLDMAEDINTVIAQLKIVGNVVLSGPKDLPAFLKSVETNMPLIKNLQWIPADSPVTPELQQTIARKSTTLFTSAKDSPFLAIYTPLFSPDKKYLGSISAGILIEQLVKSNLNPSNVDAMDIYIYDDTLNADKQLLYFLNSARAEDPIIPAKAQDFEPEYFLTKRTISIANKKWTLVFKATPQFTEYTWQAAFSAGCAILITSFIVVTAFILLEIEKRQFSNVLHEEHIQEMEGTIDQLETTKNRLQAQENLASLGGLTAGIAHEIKNPLNFINNFSTLSMELLEGIDRIVEKQKSLIPQDAMNDLFDSLDTLKENITTIHEQGMKADSTIQRMLAHSRGKPGEWALTDIHKLLEEYINFSFHGMRAKDSTFNVKIEKEFDNSLNEVEVVANDLSRVFLNLLNNAFQSITEKKKRHKGDYAPTVLIKTQNLGNYFRVTIRDNGLGISEENRNKIFTPFFTTKPTGEGTGLGLSLSYNIVTQEHEGSVTFNSVENEYCEFILTIPKRAVKKQKEAMAK